MPRVTMPTCNAPCNSATALPSHCALSPTHNREQSYRCAESEKRRHVHGRCCEKSCNGDGSNRIVSYMRTHSIMPACTCERHNALNVFCADVYGALQQQPSRFNLVFDSGQMKGCASPPAVDETKHQRQQSQHRCQAHSFFAATSAPWSSSSNTMSE